MTTYKQDDISLLLPSMQLQVQVLMDKVRSFGYQPVLFDGLRTAEEADRNAAKGTGIKNSIHEYGAAADIICDQHGWQCKAKKCKFYTVLGREAVELGFVWGGNFPSKVDQPHVQGITVAKQNAMRALGTGHESDAARDKMVREHFGEKLVQPTK
jgi:D-alanyl-D-alanine carboxypeptidase-like protein